MGIRPLVSLAVVVSLFVAACGPAKDAQNPGCVMAVSMFKPCSVDVDVDSPEHLQSMRKIAIDRTANLSGALTAFCPDSATSAAQRTQDACVASLDAAMPQVTASAAKRRAAAPPAIAALRADERYAPAREKFHTLRIQQSLACDTPDVTACKLAQNDADAAAAMIRSLLAEHHIDPRDADALGLW